MFKKIFVNIQPSPSKLNNLTLNEYASLDHLEKLIHTDLLKKTFNNPHSTKYYHNELQQLIAYKKLYCEKDKCFKVQYKQPSYGYGRVNPVKSLGAHSIRREIRHTILDGRYMDIDIVNCHPVMYYQILKDYYNYDCIALKKYIEDRNIWIKTLGKYYSEYKPVDVSEKDFIKRILIAIINGASVKKFHSDNNIKIEPHNLLIDFYKSLNKAKKLIIEGNPTLVETIKKVKKENYQNSIVAIYLQTIEDLCLSIVYKYCEKKGFNNSVILSNDGIMIRSKFYKSRYLKKFSSLIKKETGLIVDFENKPYDKKYTDEMIEEHYVDNTALIENIGIKKNFIEILDDFTSLTVANLYASMNPDTYIYSSGWYVYDKNNFCVPLDNEKIICLDIMTRMTKYFVSQYEKLDDEYKNDKKNKQYFKSIKKQLGDHSFANKVLCVLQALFNDDELHNKLNKKQNLICFKNGVCYDENIKGYRRINRDDYISQYINYDFVKEDNEPVKNELMEFFYSLFETKEETEYLLYYLGKCVFYNNEEKITCFVGRGGNGKGLICSLLNGLDCYSKQTQNDFLTSKTTDKNNDDLYHSENARFLLCDEAEGRFNESFIKSISGGDVLTVQGKYERAKTFRPFFNVFMCSNDMPKINNNDPAMERRFIMIEFPYVFKKNPVKKHEKKIDTSLKAKFNKEEYKNEFFKILIEYKDKNIEMPQKFNDNVKEYLEESDVIPDFIKQHYEITNNKKDIIQYSAVHKNYKIYCQSVDKKPLSSLKLQKILIQDYNLVLDKNGGGRKYKGIKPKNMVDDDDDDEITTKDDIATALG